MGLSLSTIASPNDDLLAFDTAARARGLDGIELTITDETDVEALGSSVRSTAVRVVALRVESGRSLESLARLSGELGVPLSVSVERSVVLSAGELDELSKVFARAKAKLLLGCTTDLLQVTALVSKLRELSEQSSVGLAWELRPNTEDLKSCGAVLLATHEHLGLVRLYGGGPEQRDQDGKGVGPLFVDLALSGYRGAIVLVPSGAEVIPRWHEWLTSRKIAGCGSTHSLAHEVDVRNVEPKDRLGTILGAFTALPPGETLHITLDHDPSCMYYALEETQPAGSFAFKKLDGGPETWAAEVKKLPV